MRKRDLFVAVADLDAENVIRALLQERQDALGIRLDFKPDSPPQGDLLRYSGRDPGCCKNAVALLRTPLRSHRHALLIFDRHGCGSDDRTREEIEAAIEQRLHASGWAQGSVSVIVIEPELEAWIWSDSPHVATVLGWKGRREDLRAFLFESGFWDEEASKPQNPKEAMRVALRQKSKPLGASLFSDLASRVSLGRCQDSAFMKFKQALARWFPA